MNKAQVEKHYDVIRWFLDNPDKGVLYKYNSKWERAMTPSFNENKIYVQNDEYAEFRKALADGETIQFKEKTDDDSNWKDLSYPNFTSGSSLDYRIKPELDWRDAFIDGSSEKVTYSCADAIKINETTVRTRYKTLCAYVSQFELGGFWYDEKYGLHFVTHGIGSDKLATYDHAMKFVKNIKGNDYD